MTLRRARRTRDPDADDAPASPDRDTRPSPLRRRAVLLACLACLVVGALAGALTMAALRPRADTSAIDNAQQTLRITAPVSQQPVRTTYQLSGNVAAPQTLAVHPNAPTAAAAQTVSGRVRAAGDAINTLDVLGEVSNNPIFAFPADVPLFRDLTGGDHGSDVVAVQQMLIDQGLLSGRPSGTVDTATSKAFDALYRKAGYNPPRANPLVSNPDFPPGAQPVLLFADTASLPTMGLTVVSAAPMGQTIDADHPLVTLQTSPARITARADLLDAEAFTQGTAVSVQIGTAAPATSTVLTVSAYDQGDGSTSPGYDITIGLPDGVDAASVAGQPVVVSETTPPPDGLAVPLTAIRTDGASSYVFKASSGTAPDQRVDVTVTGQANGYAILSDGADLSDGVQVVLSGERR